jgi:hypothetical protein
MHTYCKNSDHFPGRIYILNSCNELFKLQAKAPTHYILMQSSRHVRKFGQPCEANCMSREYITTLRFSRRIENTGTIMTSPHRGLLLSNKAI